MNAKSQPNLANQSQTGLQTIWFLYIAFIVYGTLIPFSYCDFEGCVSQNITTIAWTPFVDLDGTRASIPDMVQNVLFFMPFGFLCVLVSRQQNFLLLIRVSIVGSFLSSVVECIQLLTTDRTSSVTDVITNTIGTLLGAIAALISLQLLSGFLESPEYQALRRDRHVFLVLTAGGIVALGSLQPFDFTLDIGAIWSNVKLLLQYPPQFNSMIKDEFVVGLRFFLFSASLVYWFRELRLPNYFLKGFAFCCLTGLCFEASQLIIQSRLPTVQDALLVIFASFLGASFIVRKPRITMENSIPVQWGMGIIFLTCISAAFQSLSPFQFTYEYSSFNWIPFYSYYERTTFVALSNFIESMLIYFPMGFILQAISKKHGLSLFVCLLSLIIASSLEILQGWVVGRYPDITDIIGALVGTAGACWLSVIYKRVYQTPGPGQA